MADVQRLTPEGIAVTSPDLWKKYCKEVEDKYWQQDGLIDDATEEFIIELGETVIVTVVAMMRAIFQKVKMIIMTL